MNSSRPEGRGRSRKPAVIRSKSGKRKAPSRLVTASTILLAGIGLAAFALLSHFLPGDALTAGSALPSTAATATTATAASTTVPAATSGTTTAATAAATTAAATTAPETSATESGAWGAKFADKFTDGAVEQTASSYKSENISIKVSKVQENEITYYVADIYLRDLQYFRTAFAGGKYAPGQAAEVLDMALENNAILAITGDYYGIRESGIVIRNGEIYRERLFGDVLVMNNDGSMATFTRDEFDMAGIKDAGAWQAWSFGPMLLDGGQPMTAFNSKVTPKNPRSAIGYYEPGHYCFVLVDGRQPGYSVGMSMKELSRLFYDLGCTAAYNLDGGESAVMVFLDEWANQPYRDGRRVSDIVYIGE